MMFLHPNLANLSKISESGTRSCFAGIYVSEGTEKDGYRVEASDGKALVRVDGLNVCHPDAYPQTTALKNAPGLAVNGVIPAKDFSKACKEAPRNGHNHNLRCIAVKLDANEATLQTTDGDGSLVRQPRLIDGRWPNTDLVLDLKAPTATVKINAKRLSELLSILADLTDEASSFEVTLELRKASDPILLRCKNAQQSAVALLMPLSTK